MQKMDRVEIVPYDSTWQTIFEAEAVEIKKALGNNCIVIHHVGSTAVPGLAAKPKIDIIAVVRDLYSKQMIFRVGAKLLSNRNVYKIHEDCEVGEGNNPGRSSVKSIFFQESQLEDLGYTYRGGFNIPLRRSFTKRRVNKNINLHVFEENDPEIELNILLRDYLREHSDVSNQYAALKYKLIQEESSHVKNASIYRGYTLGKHDFIQNILKQTGFSKHRFVLCTHHLEWNVAKYFRNKYFFEPQNIEDTYAWTFNHPKHKHLVLYQGIEIIGYAHVQLWQEDRAAIRIMVIDEPKRNQNAGSKLLRLTEKWLKSLGFKSIHAESKQSNVRFYLKNGYTEMTFNDPDEQLDTSSGSCLGFAVGKIL